MEDTTRNKISEKLREEYRKRAGFPVPVIEDRFGKDFVDIVLANDDETAWGNVKYKEGTDINDFVSINHDYLCSILHPSVVIWFPEVDIRNEKGGHRLLKDLYVALNIVDGYLVGTFLLNRTTFTQAEFFSGYVHSHVHSFSMGNWEAPCLGRGPISNTITSIATSKDANLWMLFLEELRMFLETESIEGVPYIKMDSIAYGRLNRVDTGKVFPEIMQKLPKKSIDRLQPFLTEYLASMKVSVATNTITKTFYLPSDSLISFWEKLSGMVKEKSDMEHPELKDMLKKYVFNDKGWFQVTEENSRTRNLEGKKLFRFKGEMKEITVIKDEEDKGGVMMLDIQIARAIYSLIMLKINLIGYETGKKTEGHFVL